MTAAEPRRLFRPIASRFGDGEMAVLEFGDPARPVDLVFQHANGFNALTCRTLLAPLAGEARIWAVDLRGHGRSRLPTPAALRDWGVYRDDLIALLDGLDGPAPVVAGHSMGATSALLAAAKRPDLIAGLTLLDPVIWNHAASLAFRLPLLDRLAARAPIVRSTLRRRADFPDQDTAFRAYRGRGAFRGWPDDTLRDYLADGLTAAEGGGLTLACAPVWEAANYAAQAHDAWGALSRYRGPVDLVKAATGSLASIDIGARPGVSVSAIDTGDHMFPLQNPEQTRPILRQALKRVREHEAAA